MYVIRGNAAVFKCHIPSFVSDHVQVVSWHDTNDGEYTLNENYGISCIRNNISSLVSYPACANNLIL